VELPRLSAGEFLAGLRLHAPTLFAAVGPYQVACRAVVAAQCHGLTACGLLTSRTSLLPLLDLDLAIELVGAAAARRVPVSLGGRSWSPGGPS
jgi:hypothetical protein